MVMGPDPTFGMSSGPRYSVLKLIFKKKRIIRLITVRYLHNFSSDSICWGLICMRPVLNQVYGTMKRRIISLMHSSILRQIWLNFMAHYLIVFGSNTLFIFFFSDFQLFRPEYHWRDLSSRNAHLVHQNWYRTSFTF
jgi:hypothetical protein